MAVIEKPEEKLTRAKVLKRAGIGAAALWTVPLVTTGPASAATDVGGKRCAQLAVARATPEFQPGACTPCPGCNNQCRGTGNCQIGDCYCAVTAKKGCCSCTVNDSCGNLAPCQGTRCPVGFECTYTCCDGLGAPGLRCTRKCTPGAEAIPGSGQLAGSL